MVSYPSYPWIDCLDDSKMYDVETERDVMELVSTRYEMPELRHVSLSKPIVLRVVEIKSVDLPSGLCVWYVTVFENGKNIPYIFQITA